MNISIAIIEDTKADAQILTDLITDWASTNRHFVSIKHYNNPLFVLDLTAQKPLEYDLIFLDIIMPEMQGLELIRELQKTDKDMIFMLMSKEHVQYMKYGYGVKALDFLCKPFDSVYVNEALNRAVYQIQYRIGKSLCVYSDKVSYRIPYNEILFFKVMDNYVKVITTNQPLISRMTLTEIKSSLPDFFVQSSRNTIVNSAHIKSISSSDISFIGSMEKAKLTEANKREVMAAFHRYNG